MDPCAPRKLRFSPPMSPTAPPSPGTGPGPFRYRAFISYSTAADGALAPSLQAGLQRFAKPWYRIRAIRVFRDQTGLGVTPSLWGSIEKALQASDYFILLASPGAAESKWVEQEIDWWLRNRSADHLLLVLTDGEIVWDNAIGGFDATRTNALPRQLANAFSHEPRFLDLRWARAKSDLSLRHPTFADAAARLAATLRGVPLEELIGEDIRQHRKSVRLLGVAGTALAAVAVVALIAAIQGNRAWRTSERLVAQEQTASALEARVARSRQLAATSLNQPTHQQDLRILLAAEAVRLHPTAEAESALRRALSGDVQPRLLLRGHRERGCYATFSPDGTHVLTWGDATAQLRNASTGAWRVEYKGHSEDILDAKFSPDGRTVCTSSSDDSVRLWDAATGLEQHRYPHPGAVAALISPDGTRLLSLSNGGDALLWNLQAGTKIADIATQPFTYFSEPMASFQPAGPHIAICGARDPVVIRADNGVVVRTLTDHTRPVRSVQFSSDGHFLVTASEDGTARIWRVANGQCEQVLNHPSRESELLEARFSPEGAWVATRDNRATLVVWNVTTGQQIARIESSDDHDSPLMFRFSPHGTCLLTATFDSTTAELWDTATGTRLAGMVGSEGRIRTLSFSSDSGRALVGSIFAPARIYDCAPCGDVEGLLGRARQHVSRVLTTEERQQFQISPLPE
jgi:WD40 repeat protein